MSTPRVYRHRPFLAACAACLVFDTVGIGQLLTWAAHHPDLDSVLRAALGILLLLAFAAFLVLSWRVRTIVDDTGITQHWITRSYRMPYAEITAIEQEHVWQRWFLRVRCGEKTFEIIPCHTVLSHAFSGAIGPPRALLAARDDIERSNAGTAASPVAHG
ncbi:hypothetical protein [Krasilnikovia sp. MM14-A1259]|uniref:hypothetical protein n=1 Tax=Krasilnikovia sp. MM14-A1259 TaxID=3373539 RepID=UPI0037F3BD09